MHCTTFSLYTSNILQVIKYFMIFRVQSEWPQLVSNLIKLNLTIHLFHQARTMHSHCSLSDRISNHHWIWFPPLRFSDNSPYNSISYVFAPTHPTHTLNGNGYLFLFFYPTKHAFSSTIKSTSDKRLTFQSLYLALQLI